MRNRQHTLRSIAAAMLLVAYLPLVLLSFVHVHDYKPSTIAVCPDCVSHTLHAQHSGLTATHSSDCLFCHTLSFPYFGILPLTIVIATMAVGSVALGTHPCLPAGCKCHIPSRAPPFLL